MMSNKEGLLTLADHLFFLAEGTFGSQVHYDEYNSLEEGSAELIISNHVPEISSKFIPYTMLLAFLGFVFFFIGRKLDKEDRMVRILGILDWIATISVIGFYVLAILCFGL